jgi:rubrerythrin
MYPVFTKMAKEEGFDNIAQTFELIIFAEKQHDRRYKALAKNIEEGRIFKRNDTVTWRYRNCGYLHEAKQAPSFCAACKHPQAYFELLDENY